MTKMSPERYNELRTAIHSVLDAHPNVKDEYSRRGLSHTRLRWDALHASKYPTQQLYDDGLNDNHIDTALRRIFKERGVHESVGESAFDRLKNKLAHRKGVTDPAALAASIGRKKYGAKGMAAKAAAARESESIADTLIERALGLDESVFGGSGWLWHYHYNPTLPINQKWSTPRDE